MLVVVSVICGVYVSVWVLRCLKLDGAMLFHLVELEQLPKSPGLPRVSHCSDLLLAKIGPIYH